MILALTAALYAALCFLAMAFFEVAGQSLATGAPTGFVAVLRFFGIGVLALAFLVGRFL